jgi:predicted TIM-barrel fold metal-dependent hydrolase
MPPCRDAGDDVLSRTASPADTGTGSRSAEIAAVDCHAHVFRRGLPLVEARRYAPDYDAPPEHYVRMLDAVGASHGVLVQPSFLGTDNLYLLSALRRYPERLRGVAVVDPAAAPAEIDALDRAGIVGLRLNLIGLPDPPLSEEPWRRLLRRLAEIDWLVELHAEACRLPGLLEPLLRAGVNIVVDHFGRPDAAAGVDDPGFRRLLSAGPSRRVWVKLSGAYRNGDGGNGGRTARAAAPLLRDAFGPERLIWGSDWPHTQYEGAADAAETRVRLEEWLPDEEDRRIVLVDTPARLFRFLPG